jgi:hypothetical protein
MNTDMSTNMNTITKLNLPTAPLNTLLGFELDTYQVPLEQLLPSKKVQDGIIGSRKYKQLVSSIQEIGLIEPLSVIQPDPAKPEFLLLDGHLRALALKTLGLDVAPCLLARDDESFTYVAAKFMCWLHRQLDEQGRNTCNIRT